MAPKNGKTHSTTDLAAEIAKLRAENDALRAAQERGISLKVSAKGAVSVYGLGRWPVTLYHEQWTKLLGMSEQISGFIATNMAALKSKPARSEEEAEEASE